MTETETPAVADIRERISYKGLSALLRKADFILAKFPESRGWREGGWQIAIGLRTPIRIGGKKVGERTDYHVIHFDTDGYAPKAETFGHWSHGECDALKVLLAAEIKAAKKLGVAPNFHCKPTTYGGGNRALATIENTPGFVGKPVYSMSFSSSDMYLSSWGPCEPANRHVVGDHSAWWVTRPREETREDFHQDYVFTVEDH